MLGLANDLLVDLVSSVVQKRPVLDIALGRPDDMAEAQVETTSYPIFHRILEDSRGHFRALRIGCRLDRMISWLQGNEQLCELYYTRLSSQQSEIEDFWEIIRHSQFTKLMLDGFDSLVMKLPMSLVELILTHMDDTVLATNTILTQLPQLKVLSLRLQRGTTTTDVKIIATDKIVCRGLKTVWWTQSDAPIEATAAIGSGCQCLDSLSPPRNVTDEDLLALSRSALTLTELWLMDCPNITVVGMARLVDITTLRNIRIQSRFATFLAEEFMNSLASLLRLTYITIVFNGSRPENERNEELRRVIPGRSEYIQHLHEISTFKSSNLGDQIIINVKFYNLH
jgi:hypothetical protein